MSSVLEELGTILKENEITTADLEFIIKFMVSEDISPQLAMRRIKTYDQLKSKLENREDKKKIEELQNLLNDTRSKLKSTEKELEELKNAKTGLETEKMQLETKSELLDSEREELQRQLQMLQEMQFDEPEEEEELLNQIEEFKSNIEQITTKETDYKPILEPIISSLENLIENKSLEPIDVPSYIEKIDEIIKNQKAGRQVAKESKRKISDPKTRQDKKELVKQVQEKSKIQKSKKTEKSKEKEEPEDQNKKLTQVLNLFIEFIEEAESDKGFQERISTICDMDEAYEYLGSIGLSQIYSFSSRGIEKKQELINLFKSWKKDGVPN